MNKVILIGRLTADPELKYTQSGKAFSKFSLAITKQFKRDEADFINCVAWEKRAELVAEYLRKGDKAGVSGSITTGTYENQEGKKIKTFDILVEEIEFLENKKEEIKKENIKEDIEKIFKKEEKTKIEKLDDDEFPF